jgi:hypothetical protein
VSITNRQTHRRNFLPAWVAPDIAVLLIAYLALYNGLIIAGHGVPYVMDNNETFSALNHAYNLWHFDFFRSYGLADEAVSPHPAAHPVVHTHQGNFPRLFSVLLFALGARSAESQIWLTTMTVGSMSVVMAYLYFRTVAGRLFAAIALALLLTDYLMFAQWQVNTYRVWHGFFVFGTLLCVHGLGRWHPALWSAATVGIFAGLFYGELVFAAFVAGMAGLYALWVHRKHPGYVLVTWLMQGTGVTLGLGILITQLIFYMGWDAFLTDIRLTFTARNYAPGDMTFLESLQQFYAGRHIVFLRNVVSEDQYAGLLLSTRLFFRYAFQFYTPAIVLTALIIVFASYLAPLRSYIPTYSFTRAVGPRAALLLTPGLFLLLRVILSGGDAVAGRRLAGLHLHPAALAIHTASIICASVCLAYLIGAIAARLSPSGTQPGVRRMALAAFFLLVIGSVAMFQGEFYEQALSPIWFDTLTAAPVWMLKIMVFAAAMFGTALILCGRFVFLGDGARVPSAVAPFLACGALAYVVVYKLAGGYIMTGYLSRLCPFVNFHVVAFIALAPFILIAATRTLLARAKSADSIPLIRTAGFAVSALAIAFGANWLAAEWNAYRLLPPTQIAFAKILATSPAAQGVGIVSNTYATPFGLFGNTWAYTSHEFWPHLMRTGKAMTPASLPYLWQADRTNPAYARPDLFVCFSAPSTVHEIMGVMFGDQEQQRRCSLRTLKIGETPLASLVAHDAARNRWAIVRINWNSPDMKSD